MPTREDLEKIDIDTIKEMLYVVFVKVENYHEAAYKLQLLYELAVVFISKSRGEKYANDNVCRDVFGSSWTYVLRVNNSLRHNAYNKSTIEKDITNALESTVLYDIADFVGVSADACKMFISSVKEQLIPWKFK